MKLPYVTTRTVAALSVLVACSFEARGSEIPAPDPQVQELIRTSLRSESQEEMDRRLKELAAVGSQRLVPQLFLYTAQAQSTRDGMAFGVIVDALNLEPRTIVESLVPFLGADDAATRARAQNFLGEYEGASLDRAPDFELYRPYLEADLRAGKTPNLHLVQHLFEAHPGAALLLFREMSSLGQEESRELLWAEHVVADALWKYRHGFLKSDQPDAAAAEQLVKLSRSSTWWARLYVAEVVRQHAPLRDAEVVKALEQDENELVRQVFAQG